MRYRIINESHIGGMKGTVRVPRGALLVVALLFMGCGETEQPVNQTPEDSTPDATVLPDSSPQACVDHERAIERAYVPYLEAFSNSGIEIVDERLLFLSDRGGGSPQIYVSRAVDPESEPRVIAAAEDGVSWARITNDGNIVFLRDRHRDENTQIYRASMAGGEIRPLTQDAERYHQSLQFTNSGRRIVYVRGSHRSTESEIVVQSIDGGDARVVTRIAGPIELSDASDDGRVLFSKLLSMSDSSLHIVHLDSGDARRLAPSPASRGHAHQAAFSRDERSA